MGEDLERCLTHIRNTPRADGYSPAQIMFGSRRRNCLPTLPMHHKRIETDRALEEKDKTHGLATERANLHAQNASSLSPGQLVLMQDHVTGRWDRQATVQSVREDGLSYIVLSKGKSYVRGRRHLRTTKAEETSKADNDSSSRPVEDPAQQQEVTKTMKELRISSSPATAPTQPERPNQVNLHTQRPVISQEKGEISVSPPPAIASYRRSERLKKTSSVPTSH